MSGGIITIGVGLCLQRLTQLLAVMEIKRPRQGTQPDRPVVPIVNTQSDKQEAEIPSLSLPSNLALGAGLAAAAGVAGGIAVAKDGGDIVSETMAMADDMVPDPASSEIRPVRLAEIPDLEAELSLALQETAGPLNRQDTFSDSLTGLLSKTAERKRRSTITPIVTTLDDSAFPEKYSESGHSLATDTDEMTDTGTLLSVPQNAVAESITDESREDAYATIGTDSSLPTFPPPKTDSDHALATDANVESSSPDEPQQSAIVGSYKVGGRSYTMFTDGSVEAMTEHGVQRFGSMDELRHHLTGRLS